jgi:rRNA maturation RNase YbeY
MQIEIINQTDQVDTSLFKDIIDLVVEGEDHEGEFVNVIFMEQDELRALKNEYFGLDVYTDVIAFNLNDASEGIEGEIYISITQINQNAKLYKTDTQTELYRVLIHGCLHLCGYEDNTDELKRIMTSKEDLYLSNLKAFSR